MAKRNVVDFRIINLSEEKFQELKEAGQIDPNALYCTPDTTKARLTALESTTAALESTKANDSDVVHKSGDTMTGNLGMNDGGILFKDTQTAVKPSAETWHKSAVTFLDKNGVRIGWIQPYFKTDGTMELRVVSSDPINGNKYLNIGSNGNLVWNGKSVITTAGGTFTGNIAIQKEVPQINLKSTVMDITSGSWAEGRNTVAWCMDKNGYESAGVYNTTDSGGTARATLYVMSRKTGSQVQASLGVGINSSGQTYATAPNTPDGAGSNEIVTASWVKDKFVRVVAEQKATSANNYTWYRKYSDGWVEQGGVITSATASSDIVVSLPVAMANAEYYLHPAIISYSIQENPPYYVVGARQQTSTNFTVYARPNMTRRWFACGYAAS